MAAAYEIPTTPDAQIFQIKLAGVQYTINLYWSSAVNVWVIDLADIAGNKIISGIPLVANVDLLAQYGYLNLGGKLIVQTDNNITAPPTYTDLGTSGHLYFITP